MDKFEAGYKKGDRVIVTKYGHLTLTNITRKERNSSQFYHTEAAYSVHVKDIFLYTRDGIQAAREHYLQGYRDQIENAKKLIVEAETELEQPVVLRVERPTPSEKHYYQVSEDGFLSEIVDK